MSYAPGALRDQRMLEAAEYVRRPEPLSPAQRDALLPVAARIERLDQLQPDAWPALLAEWPYWARPTQLAPVGRWIIWLILAGRGWGKSRTGIEWIREGIDSGNASTFGLIGPTRNDTYDRLVYGDDAAPGLVRLYAHLPDRLRPVVNSQRNTITLRHRPSMGYIFTAEKPEVRGPNMRRWLCDELATWPYLKACWSNIEMTTRALGTSPPQICVTTTPRPLEVLKDLLDDPRCAVTFGSTFANAANLAASWIGRMARKYANGRLGAQELFGLLLGDNPDALYHQTTIDRHRCNGLPPAFQEIALGIDPALTTRKRADLTGIVAVGRDARRHLYPLLDVTGADFDRAAKGLVYSHPVEPRRHRPDEWGELVCRAYYHLRACYPGVKVTVVGERNAGGDMVKSNVLQTDRLTGGGGAIPYDDPTTRIDEGKPRMHDSLAAACENGFVHVVGSLPLLETEAIEWNPKVPGPSPNRIDAMRIASSYLCPEIWKEEPPDPAVAARDAFAGFAAAQDAMPAPAWGAPFRERNEEPADEQAWDRV